MAKAPEKEEGAAEAPKKKSKLMLFIILGVVAVVLIGGGGAFFLLKKKSADEADAEGDGGTGTKKEAKADKSHPGKPPTYVKLEQFTTNMMAESPEQQPQYIQVVVEMRVSEETAGEIIKGYMPELRDKILRLLSSRKPSQLLSLEGKDALATEIRSTVNTVVNPPQKKGKSAGKEVEPEGPVESVHFSSFIIQ
jgi:flagellar FliL protein